jgi:uncharacterized protein
MKTVIDRLTLTDKAVVIYGPRQVGKTTLANDVIAEIGLKTLSINGDELRFADILSSRDSRKLNELVSGFEMLFLDEAQRIPNIGINLKIIIDSNPKLKVLATGSSSFELAGSIAEPLTGRKWTVRLYPIATVELARIFNDFELRDQLDERLVWGSYPNLFNLTGRELKIAYLRELTTDYLYKDILQLDLVRDSSRIRDLLRLLAFQIGSEVSLTELGTQLGMSKGTAARYMDLLEKTFVIFRLGGLSRNLRKEVSKSAKYYFHDVGIRNALVDDFRPLEARDDVGKLWENFLVAERIKRNHYLLDEANAYFWRTYTGSEIDYVEEKSGAFSGYQIKSGRRAIRAPAAWLEYYRNSAWQTVDRENWLDFVR